MNAVALSAAVDDRAGRPQPAVEDLLVHASTVQQRLDRAMAAGDTLDVYLLTAALWQLVDDRLHPDPAQLRRAAGFVRGRAPLAAAGLDGLATACAWPTPARRLLAEASRRLAGQAVRLATAVLDDAAPPAHEAALSGRVLHLLGDDIVRLPAGFTGFDQHPDDVVELAHRYFAHTAAPDAAVCVLGVRTSGSYLAPLCAAALRRLGVEADVVSFRPQRPLLGWERQRLRTHARSGGRVVIIDDPPGAGTALAAAAHAVAATGIPTTGITVLTPLFGTAPPALLRGFDIVSLPWADWSIHRRLAAAPQTFASMVAPRWVLRSTVPVPDPALPDGRGHACARFRVELTDTATGSHEERELLVEGAGLGLYGRTALGCVRLGDRVPEIYGFADGLLYTEDLPAAPSRAVPPGVIADYVADRSRALPVASDPTVRLLGRSPAWQVAAATLSRPFGPAAPVAELALGGLCRRLMRVVHPCLVDGDTAPGRWRLDRDGSLRKTGFHDATYSHADALCYDPVFDLAGAAQDADPAGQHTLWAAYTERTGERVDPERWLLYRLAHAWRDGQTGLAHAAVTGRQAAAINEYLAELYLSDVTPPPQGDVCALDLDGVLESDRFGAPATTPAGALALRALLRHGYRPVPVSGRSLPDVRDRCAAFGLAGGVAEYGAVTYVPGDGARDLRTPADRALLARVRSTLTGQDGVAFDPDYRYGVRARGPHGPVPAAVQQALAAGEPDLRLIQGDGQTDVSTVRIDKATGLQSLAVRLSAPGCALAVGDTAPDAAMLLAARCGLAPANVSRELRALGVPSTRHGYQTGLVEACAVLLGHRPGRCPVCRPPRFSARSRAVLAVLAAPEPQPLGLAGAAARVAAYAIGWRG